MSLNKVVVKAFIDVYKGFYSCWLKLAILCQTFHDRETKAAI